MTTPVICCGWKDEDGVDHPCGKVKVGDEWFPPMLYGDTKASHGLCPECAKATMDEVKRYKEKMR